MGKKRSDRVKYRDPRQRNYVYVGLRDAKGHCTVTARVFGSGDDRPLDPRLDLANHSPTGFNWGYSGSGAAQLALAILANDLGDDSAMQNYQEFKHLKIAELNTDFWEMSSDDIQKVMMKLRGYFRIQRSGNARDDLGRLEQRRKVERIRKAREKAREKA